MLKQHMSENIITYITNITRFRLSIIIASMVLLWKNGINYQTVFELHRILLHKNDMNIGNKFLRIEQMHIP